MTTNERELLDALKQAAAALAVIARHADNRDARDRKSFALGAFNAARAAINNAEDFRTIRERAEERALEPGRISTREMGD